MGLFELLFYIVLVVLAAAGTIWVINYWAPTHPPIIDKAIWFVVVVIIVVMLVVALGLGAHDIQVPHIFGGK